MTLGNWNAQGGLETNSETEKKVLLPISYRGLQVTTKDDPKINAAFGFVFLLLPTRRILACFVPSWIMAMFFSIKRTQS